MPRRMRRSRAPRLRARAAARCDGGAGGGQLLGARLQVDRRPARPGLAEEAHRAIRIEPLRLLEGADRLDLVERPDQAHALREPGARLAHWRCPARSRQSRARRSAPAAVRRGRRRAAVASWPPMQPITRRRHVAARARLASRLAAAGQAARPSAVASHAARLAALLRIRRLPLPRSLAQPRRAKNQLSYTVPIWLSSNHGNHRSHPTRFVCCGARSTRSTAATRRACRSTAARTGAPPPRFRALLDAARVGRASAGDRRAPTDLTAFSRARSGTFVTFGE